MSSTRKTQPPARRRGDDGRGHRATSEELNARYSFRRNRTLTGSLVSNVASANEQRAELQSPRVYSHHLRRKRRYMAILFTATFVVMVLLNWMIYQSIARIAIVPIGVTQKFDGQPYEKKAQDYLNAHVFERSRLSLDTHALSDYLQDNGFPEVSSVGSTMSNGGFGKSNISVTLRRPVVSWQTGSTKVYVDSQGVSFRRNYFDEPSVAVVDQTNVQSVDNRVLASDNLLSFMGRAIDAFRTQGMTVQKVVLPADTIRQVQVMIAGTSYPIKLTIDRPAAGQVEDAARGIRFLKERGINATYLDVRVSGKAFYK